MRPHIDATGYPPCALLDDPREIVSVSYDYAQAFGWRLWEGTCTRIVAYPEKGVGDFMPWIAILKSRTEHLGDAGSRTVEDVVARIPAWKVTITYREGRA